jgi:hypothetical protein
MPSPSTTRLAAAAAALLAAGALARAASDARRQRVDAFREQARVEREKLKLDPAALRRAYPTPEIRLARGPITLRPGATTAVEVGGAFQQGSLFDVDAEDVEVLREELTSAAWKAQLGVRKGALPQSVTLRVYSPVSAIGSSATAFVVAGRYDCQVQLQRGLSARLVAQAADPLRYDLTWTRPPSPSPLRRSVARLKVAYGALSFDVEGDQAELMASLQRSQEPGGAQAQAMAEMEKCQKLKDAEMIRCFQAAGERIKVIQAKDAEESVAAGPPCGQLDLRIRAGQVEGGTFRACLSSYEDRVAKATCTPLD